MIIVLVGNIQVGETNNLSEGMYCKKNIVEMNSTCS